LSTFHRLARKKELKWRPCRRRLTNFPAASVHGTKLRNTHRNLNHRKWNARRSKWPENNGVTISWHS
jgi:hypothetical protein